MVLSLRRTRLGARPRLYGEPGYPIDAVRAPPPSSPRFLYIDRLYNTYTTEACPDLQVILYTDVM